jgi:hypothetical protein
LFPLGGEPFGPYLQILHYQCIVANFYDHAVATLYEFSPRGAAANSLFQRYPAALAPAANPFLNNAKAVDRLDAGWAATRADATGAARALVRLLSGLEEMGFSARREYAAWLRWWLHRGLRLQVPAPTQLPMPPTAASISAVLDHVAGGETNTGGVIEQRIVDAVVSTRHPTDDGWRARGLADSVNASNVSRRKLGDCDFQHAADRRVVAYEAHAGVLSGVYLASHFEKLRRILPLRIEEWAGIADVEEWSVEVNFIAHDFAADVLGQGAWVDEASDLSVNLKFVRIGELIEEAPPPDQLIDAFGEQVVKPLNERRTPEGVRLKYAAMSGY